METKTLSTKDANATRSLRVVGERSFAIDYVFDAPRERVFAHYTDPKLVPLWWGGNGSTVRVERMDVRPGGSYRFVQTRGDRETAFGGEYREVSIDRLVYTFSYGGPVMVATVELRQVGERTHLTLTTECPTKEDRENLLKYGAEAGAKAAWSRLAEILAQPAAAAPGSPSPSPLGTLGYVTLFVSDQDRALDFYTRVLGMTPQVGPPQPGGHRFITVELPGQPVRVSLWPGTPGKSGPVQGNIPGALICVVPDIEAAFADLKARGATLAETRPVKAPFASYATVLDPDGNRIMLQQQPPRDAQAADEGSR